MSEHMIDISYLLMIDVSIFGSPTEFLVVVGLPLFRTLSVEPTRYCFPTSPPGDLSSAAAVAAGRPGALLRPHEWHGGLRRVLDGRRDQSDRHHHSHRPPPLLLRHPETGHAATHSLLFTSL